MAPNKVGGRTGAPGVGVSSGLDGGRFPAVAGVPFSPIDLTPWHIARVTHFLIIHLSLTKRRWYRHLPC